VLAICTKGSATGNRKSALQLPQSECGIRTAATIIARLGSRMAGLNLRAPVYKLMYKMTIKSTLSIALSFTPPNTIGAPRAAIFTPMPPPYEVYIGPAVDRLANHRSTTGANCPNFAASATMPLNQRRLESILPNS